MTHAGDELLEVPAVAEILHRTEATIRTMVRRGDLEGSRVGNRILIPRSAIDDMLERTRIRPIRPDAGHAPRQTPKAPPRDTTSEIGSFRERVKRDRKAA